MTTSLLPENWQGQFEPTSPNGKKVKCKDCSRAGWPGGDSPNPWQFSCLQGHPYQCSDCGEVFTSATGLAGHRRLDRRHRS